MRKARTLFFAMALFPLGIFAQTTGRNNEPAAEAPPTNNEQSHTVVDEMPEFPGGVQALQKFLLDNVLYPQAAWEKNIQGSVYVRFVVDVTGKLEEITLFRGLHPALDNEALRVVNLMPRWKPALLNGQPVRMQYTLPINFRIQ